MAKNKEHLHIQSHVLKKILGTIVLNEILAYIILQDISINKWSYGVILLIKKYFLYLK